MFSSTFDFYNNLPYIETKEVYVNLENARNKMDGKMYVFFQTIIQKVSIEEDQKMLKQINYLLKSRYAKIPMSPEYYFLENFKREVDERYHSIIEETLLLVRVDYIVNM